MLVTFALLVYAMASMHPENPAEYDASVSLNLWWGYILFAAAIASAVKRPAAAPRTETGEKVINKPAPSAGSASAVKSPLPGTIMNFKVSVGDTVNAGDTVCVLEAMKMENDIHAQNSGTVKKICVNVGDAVLEGADIMIIE